MQNENNYVALVILSGILAMAFAFRKASWINKQNEGNERMKTIGASIADGAMAFLRAEYRILGVFVVAVAFVLGFANSGRADSSAFIALSFIIGAVASGFAGFLGMKVATKANNRTTHAAETSLAKALNVAFGRSCDGFKCCWFRGSRLGNSFYVYGEMGIFNNDISIILNVLSGFSLGASSIALFARVGGGIYTKAADVGADLVGKVESGIPEIILLTLLL